MSISILDNLESASPDSAAAVVAVVPINTASVDGVGCGERPLDPARADALVTDLLRITGGGPLAFIVMHNDHEWADCFKRHGLTPMTGLFLLDSFGVVIGSAGPVRLPTDEFIRIGPLVQAVTSLVSRQGDSVVIPFAYDPIATIAVASMNRQAVAVAKSSTHSRYLRAALAGEVQTEQLDPEEYAEALRRLATGETSCSIARSMGIIGDRLRRRLEKDGHRPRRIRGAAKAAATLEQQATQGGA